MFTDVSTAIEAKTDDMPKNFAFLFLPFVCREREGNRGSNNVDVPEFPRGEGKLHWREVTVDNNTPPEQREDRYLFTYAPRIRGIGEEGNQEKGGDYYTPVRHYVFEPSEREERDSGVGYEHGIEGVAENCLDLGDPFYKEMCAAKRYGQSGSLWDFNRSITDEDPVFGNSSYNRNRSDYCRDLRIGKTLGSVFTKPECPTDLCWHIVKKHRFNEPGEGRRPNPSNQDQIIDYSFTILKVHLYRFSTGVGILAFEIRFPEDNPYKIAAALFHLKKVQWTKIGLVESSEKEGIIEEESNTVGEIGISPCELARLLLCDYLGATTVLDLCSYFFFQVQNFGFGAKSDVGKEARANVLVFMPEKLDGQPDDEEIDKKLFFLGNCFDVDVPYSKKCVSLSGENLYIAPDIRWSITPECLACYITYPDLEDSGHERYTTDVFALHVRYQYRYLYLLLLHQKYVYYRYLKAVSHRTEGDKGFFRRLELEQTRLDKFNEVYTFSRVTEIVHEHVVYEAVARAMGLHQLKEDVREPMERLVAQREKDRETWFNIIGIALASTGVLSLIVDIASFMQSGYGVTFRKAIRNAFRIVGSVGIVGIRIVGSVGIVGIAIVYIMKKRRHRQ